MHRWTIPAISAAVLLSVPLTRARADDLFTLVGNGGTTITFSLPGTPDIPDGNYRYDYFYIQGTGGDRFNLPYTVNGQPELTDEFDFFLGNGFAIDDYNSQNFVQQTGPGLFSGTTAHPTFLLGTFNLTSALPACTDPTGGRTCVTNGENYTLTISDETAVTPEPTSLALLGTGVLGIAGLLQRRRVRV